MFVRNPQDHFLMALDQGKKCRHVTQEIQKGNGFQTLLIFFLKKYMVKNKIISSRIKDLKPDTSMPTAHKHNLFSTCFLPENCKTQPTAYL